MYLKKKNRGVVFSRRGCEHITRRIIMLYREQSIGRVVLIRYHAITMITLHTRYRLPGYIYVYIDIYTSAITDPDKRRRVYILVLARGRIRIRPSKIFETAGSGRTARSPRRRKQNIAAAATRRNLCGLTCAYRVHHCRDVTIFHTESARLRPSSTLRRGTPCGVHAVDRRVELLFCRSDRIIYSADEIRFILSQ